MVMRLSHHRGTMRVSLSTLLNLFFGAVGCILLVTLMLAWEVSSAPHVPSSGSPNSVDAQQANRLQSAALLELVVLTGDSMIATPEGAERQLHLRIVDRYMDLAEASQFSAVSDVLAEGREILGVLAQHDRKEFDLEGLWVPCKSRMLFLAEALRSQQSSSASIFSVQISTGGSFSWVLLPCLGFALLALAALYVSVRSFVLNPVQRISQERGKSWSVAFGGYVLMIDGPEVVEGQGETDELHRSKEADTDFSSFRKGYGNDNAEPDVDSKTSVLLVEDSPLSAEVSLHVLRNAGLVPQHFESGFRALEAAEHSNYRMVFVDISMPGMDGYEVARRLKKLTRYRLVPVFALTADEVPSVAEACRESGMLGVLKKPLTVPVLHALLQGALEEVYADPLLHSEGVLVFAHDSYEPGAIPSSEGIASGSPPKIDCGSPVTEVLPVLDVQFALNEMGIGMSQYAELLNEVLTWIPTYINDVERLLREKDLVNLGRLAHRIKGESGNVGAVRVRRDAEELERVVCCGVAGGVSNTCDSLLMSLSELATVIRDRAW
ncbi:response regulator [Desulfovibrio mangrovi]|uniref:response regulator n=1 Tax=Desulfovibrio mangrovi TaxID=2976983 RepID=UPI0022458BCB|nr:response regulator [Desulfovibrio mangrovi]UZP68620.1 response regulator [Desulfovibrio mangrovi]